MVKVLKPGFYSTIQDNGRFGYQEYGVPISGAMDRRAFNLANILLGNNKDLPAIEMTMMGGKLEFDCTSLICITGANMEPSVNGVSVMNNRVVTVKKGDVLSFGKLQSGFRCYLAVLGGFLTEYTMGSSSMYKGITKQFILPKNDVLKVEACDSDYKPLNSNLRVNTSYLSNKIIEVYEGPEFDRISEDHKKLLFDEVFTISKDNNRMAYQLNETIENNLESIITTPVLPGTVQLTPSGKLIILMRDCQTTGGYPRVLQLKESAINILSQKHTGNSLRFKLNKL